MNTLYREQINHVLILRGYNLKDGDPWTAKYNKAGNLKQRRSSGGPTTDERVPIPINRYEWLKVRAIIESDARSTSVKLKSAAKLSSVIWLNTKHATVA